MSAVCVPRGCGRFARRCRETCAWGYSYYYLLLDGMVCSSLAGTPMDRSIYSWARLRARRQIWRGILSESHLESIASHPLPKFPESLQIIVNKPVSWLSLMQGLLAPRHAWGAGIPATVNECPPVHTRGKACPSAPRLS